MKQFCHSATVIAVVTLLSLSPSYAQFRFSLGAEAVMPTGDLADLGGIGGGLSGRVEAGIGEKVALGAHAGFVAFSKKSPGNGSTEYAVSGAPIQLDGRYYFNELQDGLYAGIGIGLHWVRTAITGGTDDSQSNLTFAPQIGFHLKKIDLNLRYQIINDAKLTYGYVDPVNGLTYTSEKKVSYGYLAARVALVFGKAP
jgi:hypothetical protein